MKDLKNIFTTISAVLMAGAGALLASYSLPPTALLHLALPSWAVTTCVLIITLGGSVIGVLTGKNPDLTKKTTNQLNKTEQEK